MPLTAFRWVDFAARTQPGFRNHVVPVDQVPALVARFGPEECYALRGFARHVVVLQGGIRTSVVQLSTVLR